MYSFVTFPMLVYFPVYIYNKLFVKSKDFTEEFLRCRVLTSNDSNIRIECDHHENIEVSQIYENLSPYCNTVNIVDIPDSNKRLLCLEPKDPDLLDTLYDMMLPCEDPKDSAYSYLPIISQTD
jgi:hypothetical protein